MSVILVNSHVVVDTLVQINGSVLLRADNTSNTGHWYIEVVEDGGHFDGDDLIVVVDMEHVTDLQVFGSNRLDQFVCPHVVRNPD